jgi:predicted RNase H-like nuclease (RuvC/YqgF family)
MTNESAELQPLEGEEDMRKYIALANSRLTAYSAQIERLKAENLNLKRTVRHMERRILRSEHEDE